MSQILTVKDVPAEKVAETTENLKNAGATDVAAEQQPDGKFTLTATFPD